MTMLFSQQLLLIQLRPFIRARSFIQAPVFIEVRLFIRVYVFVLARLLIQARLLKQARWLTKVRLLIQAWPIIQARPTSQGEVHPSEAPPPGEAYHPGEATHCADVPRVFTQERRLILARPIMLVRRFQACLLPCARSLVHAALVMMLLTVVSLCTMARSPFEARLIIQESMAFVFQMVLLLVSQRWSTLFSVGVERRHGRCISIASSKRCLHMIRGGDSVRSCSSFFVLLV